MEAYRDQYAKIFNGGKKVVLIGISTDPDTTLAAWSREASYPFLFASDTARTVGQAYGSATARYHTRNVFIVGPDGRVVSKMLRFNVMSADAYTDLGKMIEAAIPKAASPP